MAQESIENPTCDIGSGVTACPFFFLARLMGSVKAQEKRHVKLYSGDTGKEFGITE